MRVTHFSSLDSGTGAGNAAYRIHRGLLDLGVDSRLWLSLQRRTDPGLRQLPRGGLFPRLIAKIAGGIERRSLRNLAAKSDYVFSTGFFGVDPAPALREDQPDLVQLHWIGGSTLPIRSLARIPVPLVWRLPDMWPFCGVEYLVENDTRYREGYSRKNRPAGESGFDISRLAWENKKRTYQKIRSLTLVCPSRWLAGCVQRSSLLGDRRTVIIKTGCDTGTYYPRESGSCRNVLGLSPDSRLILTGATCMKTRWKGADLFVEATQKLVQRNPHSRIEVVAFGEGGEALQKSLPCPVRNFGSVKSEILMSALYSAADVFAAPSRLENLANTVLESMGCGTPCVAFDIGGMPDAIDHQVNGYVARPFDTLDYSIGLETALGPAARPWRTAARSKIEREFTLEGQARQFRDLYEEILNPASNRPRIE